MKPPATRTAEEIVELLSQPLDSNRVVKSDEVYGSYLESFDLINTANYIFGYNGWTDTGSLTFLPEIQAFTARVQIHVPALGTTHEDVETTQITIPKGGRNAGQLTNTNIKMASNNAYTTAFKRAIRKFGEQFGNGLYDKHSPLHAEARHVNTPPPAAPSIFCDEPGCGKPLTDSIKNGSVSVSAQQKADISKEKFGKVLCFDHFQEAMKAAKAE